LVAPLGDAWQAMGALARLLGRALPLLSVVLYIASSLVMTLTNKSIVSQLKFPGTNTLLLVECVVTVACLDLCRILGLRRTPFSRGVLTSLPLVTGAKAGNMMFSFLAMKYTSIPVYNVLKRSNTIFTLVVDFAVRSKVPSYQRAGSVVVMALGTSVTFLGDLDFERLGYAVAILAAVFQAAYLVLSKRAEEHVPGLTSWDLLYYTAFFNTFLFSPLAYREVADIRVFMKQHDFWEAAAPIGLYVALGASLNYTTFLCTSVNEPLTTGVAANAKSVLSTAAGVFIYGSTLSILGWTGFVMNVTGAFAYTLLGISEKSRAKKD